jgi:V-type H+-transporting ATPase subunit E
MEDPTAVKEALPKEVAKMTAFIHQEAEEKAKEIKIRADEEYAVEKARLVRQDSGQVEAMLTRKLRDGETRKKVTESAQANKERLKVLTERDLLLKGVFDEIRDRMVTVQDDHEEYKKLLHGLLTESLSKLSGENEVLVECRPKDRAILESICPGGMCHTVKVHLDQILKDECSGGIVVKSKSGKIRCDNTLESRLSLAIEKMIPEIRVEIFGVNSNRKFND